MTTDCLRSILDEACRLKARSNFKPSRAIVVVLEEDGDEFVDPEDAVAWSKEDVVATFDGKTAGREMLLFHDSSTRATSPAGRSGDSITQYATTHHRPTAPRPVESESRVRG